MSFLGDVNIFHGRHLPGLDIPKPTLAYARPHDLDIDRTPRAERSLAASVRHVNAAGALVKVELLLHDQQTVVQANLSRDRHRELDLKPGEEVYVVPRQLRIFVDDEKGTA